MKRNIVLLLVVFGVASLLFATGQSEKATGETISGTLNFYTTSIRPLADQQAQDFKELYPGVQVNVYRSGTGEVLAKLQTEIDSGAVQADVVSFTDITYFSLLAKQGLLHQYRSPSASSIEPQYVYEDGMYYDFFIMTVAIGYNTLNVKDKDPPRSWSDLIDPKYKNKIGIPNPVYSGVALTTLCTIVKNPGMGWDYYRKLKGNGVKIFRGNPATAQAIASGEIFLGVVSYGDLLAMKDQGSPIDLVFIKEGGPLISQPIGIMKSTKNRRAAELFVDYILSEKGLSRVSELSGFATTNLKIKPEGLDVSTLAIMPTDWEFLADSRAELIAKFEEIFGKQ